VLAALEGMARAYRTFVAEPSVEYGYPKGLYAWDPCCEYRYTPGFTGFFEGPVYGHIPIRTNSAGYRDEEFAPARTPGALRVAFLGDSVTMGAGVRAEDRFSDRLRELSSGARRIETLNLAVNSYTSWHYAQQARAVLPGYAPDLIVVGLCLNDLERKEESWPRKHVAAPDGSYVGKYLRPGGKRPHMRDLSALASLAWELDKRWRNRDPWRTWMRRLGGEWQDPARLAELRANLTVVRDESAKAGRGLVVLVLPEAHDLADPQRYGAPRRAALALLDELGIARIDLSEDFRKDAEYAALFLPGDSIHLSVRGHALAARALGAWLASHGPRVPGSAERALGAEPRDLRVSET
jgi:lysophospholipase L1-like esterase